MDVVMECRHVTYFYPLRKRPALTELSVTLERGKLYGVIGPNGAGKTTFCALLRGFVPGFYGGEYTGEVRLHKKPLEDYGCGLAKEIGYVVQNPFTQLSGIKETVFEEVAYGLEQMGVPVEEIEPRVVEAMRQTNIENFAMRNPLQLSGGQIQRVALASVLVQDPEILVIDEPTSQLDPRETKDVFDIIQRLKASGKTIVLVEHKIDLIAEYADEILVFSKGCLVKQGKKTDLFTDESLEDLGVEVPHIARLGKRLKELGVPLEQVPVTEEQAIQMIRALLGREIT